MADGASVLDRPGPEPDVELRYGQGPEQVAELWWPSTATGDSSGAAGPAPGAALVLLLHGGFWKAEYDRLHLRALAAAVAAAGFVAVSVEYRRVGQPGGGWPGTFDDIALAVDRVPELVAAAALADGVAHRAAVTAAGGRVVLVGHSAGGHLALWAAARRRLPPGSRWHGAAGSSDAATTSVVGVVALAPVGDLAAAEASQLGGGAVERLLATRSDDDPEPVEHVDPASLLPVGVTTIVLQGTDDEDVPLEHARGYAGLAHDAGDRKLRLVELPRTGHYELIDPASSAWPVVLAAISELAPGAPDTSPARPICSTHPHDPSAPPVRSTRAVHPDRPLEES